ncbi:hypothetical protein ACIQZO_15745 [Streptomyces sp. NPDC097617]|uniref:hypothetical protein n=1 Tax=Streptomyces sp. NPDC097617 TaxID=3366091 RepID=UPI00381F736C
MDPALDPWASTDLPTGGEAVDGLGERALIQCHDERRGPRLRVLDGGEVFTMGVDRYWNVPGPPGPEAVEEPTEPDIPSIRAAMIEDMRPLMAALRK